MSRSAKISFAWADGDYTFRLAIAQLEELQEKTDCGPLFLLNRINSAEWRVQDLRETIRLGLIGGGMAPTDALKLVKRYVDDRPLIESIKPASAILTAAIIGARDGEKPGKAKATKTAAATISQEENSPLPPSTGPLQ